MARTPSVDEFLSGLSHARKDDVQRLRALILACDPGITEHVKWNAPSFCWHGDDRITMRLQPGDRLQLIFHRGARPKGADGFAFDDPSGLMHWAAADRAVVTIDDLDGSWLHLGPLVLAWLRATG